ncbi:MAG: isochorismatase family protein [Lachnospiraceae bacterium]|nr:isochorismatase family protein [Lachnospiraceae bacterium]
MKKALLVIDMQNICVGEEHAAYFKYDNEALIKAVNDVIASYECNRVVYIKNVMKKSIISKLAPFQAYEGTKEVELVVGLNVVSEYIFTKYEGNAFSNPMLGDFLKEQNIECVEVVGVDGGGCVSLTSLGALKEGYKVIVNESAIGTMFEKKKEKYFKKLRYVGVKFI